MEKTKKDEGKKLFLKFGNRSGPLYTDDPNPFKEYYVFMDVPLISYN
jgi:hypothetical protein